MTTKSMWETAEEMANTYAKGGTWVRMQDDNDKVVGMFRGEPKPRERCFNPKTEKYEEYGEDQKKLKMKPQLRIAMCLVTPDEICHIWEMSVQAFKTLLEVKKKYGLDRFYEITRKGEKGDTKTSYTILPEDPPSKEVLEKMHAVELLDIEAEYARGADDDDDKTKGSQKEFKKKEAEKKAEEKRAETPAASPPPAAAPALAVAPPAPVAPAVAAVPPQADTIDAKIAQSIGVVLKELPKMADGLKAFLGHFEIKRIKDIPKAKEQEAIELAQSIAASQGVGQAAATEVDPFA